MNDTTKHICIVTGTRADWGLLTPLAHELRKHAGVRLSIVATNMHLSEAFGNTANEITAAGFDIAARVPMTVADDTPAARVHAMAMCMNGMADTFTALSPDCCIILGDRYEMLATASAAAMMGIPIAHIAGGTVSFGAVDDSLRHAITKLASLHLVETDEHRHRVVQMGEDPDDVIATGALGVWNITHCKLMTRHELEASLDGFALDSSSTLLATYHPATLDHESPASRFTAFLEALDRFPQSNILITYPNNDAGGNTIAAMVEEYARAQAGRVKAVKSLGMLRYLSALRCVAAVVGNSSSGIVEVPSMHIPTVDVGIRQAGRQCAASVIHCGDTADDIAAAIKTALSPEFRTSLPGITNPYHNDDTVRIMAEAVIRLASRERRPKLFHDIK